MSIKVSFENKHFADVKDFTFTRRGAQLILKFAIRSITLVGELFGAISVPARIARSIFDETRNVISIIGFGDKVKNLFLQCQKSGKELFEIERKSPLKSVYTIGKNSCDVAWRVNCLVSGVLTIVRFIHEKKIYTLPAKIIKQIVPAVAQCVARVFAVFSYYYLIPQIFSFGKEIKTIVSTDFKQSKNISEYLNMRYTVAVAKREAIIKGVKLTTLLLYAILGAITLGVVGITAQYLAILMLSTVVCRLIEGAVRQLVQIDERPQSRSLIYV